MSSIPPRLISNEEKINFINDSFCNNCRLNRRTTFKQVFTPGDELDANIWSSKDIFGLSLNIDICNIEELPIESYQDDVNIVPIDDIDIEFTSDAQLTAFDFENILTKKFNTPIIYLIMKELQSIIGTYPYKSGTPEEEIYNFKIEVEYRPMVLNASHFQVEVFSDEGGKWVKIDRENKKKYIRSLASKIRNKILDEKKVYPLTMTG